MDLKKGDDHWAFLDEIEAPMWVDLTLESKSNNEDVNDEWFGITHPIHQCSSRKLKSAFSRSGGSDTVADSELERPNSPEVPLSVSRSRGKEYKSKKWRENGCKLFSSFPVLKTVSQTRPVQQFTSTENLKASCSKPISSSSNSASNLNSKVDKALGRSSSTVRSVECTSTQNPEENYSKPISSSCSSVGNLNSMVDEAGGRSSTLLAVMKISLRKSCATRQPLRVEVYNDKRESNGSKSLSGKSSVASSCNPGNDVKSLTVSSTMVKEITPDSKNVVKLTRVIKNKANLSNLSKASTVQVEKLRKEDKMKPVYREAPKSKVLCSKLHSKPLQPVLNGKYSLTASTKGDAKVKIGVSRLNKAAAAGKENARGEVAMSQSTNNRDIGARGMLRGQKGMKQSTVQKEDRTGLLCSKEGILRAQNRRKPTGTIQRPHFR